MGVFSTCMRGHRLVPIASVPIASVPAAASRDEWWLRSGPGDQVTGESLGSAQQLRGCRRSTSSRPY